MNGLTKNIFVSHYHSDAEKIEDMKDLLSKKGFHMRDSSIYEAKSKNDAHNEDYIKSIIRPHIDWAGTVIVLIGENTADSDWVRWEIEAAARKDKRIIGVYLQGESESSVPDSLIEHGAALVKWNTGSIIDAICGEDIWNGPDRNWDTERVTC